MDEIDSKLLFRLALKTAAETRSEKPASLKKRKREAWIRSDAFVHHTSDDLDDDPEAVERALGVLNGYLQPESDQESDSSIEPNVPYRNIRKLRKKIDRGSRDPQYNPLRNVRVSNRKRDGDAVIESLFLLEEGAKRRRVLHREEPHAGDTPVEDHSTDLAILMRRHLLSLDNALRKQWKCVCQNCSGLSVRLSLPQQKKGNSVETSFEVFFGKRSQVDTALQEARITVKDVYDNRLRSASEPAVSTMPDFVHICQSITESLGQRSCLHFALEAGIFERLRPRPKAFGVDGMSRTISLAALFKLQQELKGGSYALPLKGRRILAVTLATALLPFLETPWLQPSFNHSKIQFFEPMQDGELPDITKPFLSMEHIPFSPNRREDTGANPDSSNFMVHPNTSVLALGKLLCELHYCTPVELKQKDSDGPKDVNADYYSTLEILKDLEQDAGQDYFLATKACLQWEYLPPGEQAEFESVSVQRRFYQTVVKRLEAEITKSWELRIEDLASLDARVNEFCWGSVGRELVRNLTNKSFFTGIDRGGARETPHRSMSEGASVSFTALNPGMVPQMPRQQLSPVTQLRGNIDDPLAKNLQFFDASYQMGSEQEHKLSKQWMGNLYNSIQPYIDPFETVELGNSTFRPVRIAILDSGFDPSSPLVRTAEGDFYPQIKRAESFVQGTGQFEIQDEIGHGTHALGLLLQVATSAEIYIAKVAHRETLDRNSYNDIAKAIKHAVDVWNVDIISMSFGIREHNEPMATAISHALSERTLLFAAASNDGANRGRAFPAKHPSVFCIHSTDGNGKPSAFNPSADTKDVNFSTLGEHVESHWPIGKNNSNDQSVNISSGTSVATPIAAGLAAAVLSFVRQQEQHLAVDDETLLGPRLKNFDAMHAVLLKGMTPGGPARDGYDYIAPHFLFNMRSTREKVYDKLRDIIGDMYY